MRNEIYTVIRSALCLAACTYAVPALAQVVPDGTLPVNSTVAPNGNSFVIEGGTTAGANLFHSFSEFSLPTGSEALFNNVVNIENIISRVTGGSISNIDGLIRANGGANLFLINPSGIVFGPNASLDIGGSFLGSSADGLRFEDGSLFSAAEPNAPPLLTVNVPVGLQFGSNPNAIQVNSSGHNLSIEEVPFDEQFRTFAPLVVPDRSNRTVGLQVSDGNTLALVGGDITLNGGNLTAFAGRVELGSVSEPGLVSLTPASNGFTFDYSSMNAFGDINLSQAASIDISGAGSGDLQIQGKTITLTDSSTILSQTLGAENGGNSLLNASESVLFQGTVTADVPTAWFNRVEAGATGNGGTLAIETGDLLFDTNAFISSSTLGSGDGGDISVRAINIETTKPIELILAKPTGLFSTVFPDATGMGGDLNLQTERLQMENAANVQAIVLGAGKGGDLQLQAQTVVVSTVAGLVANSFGMGNAGDMTIQAELLQALNGGQIATGTFASGDSGRLTVQTIETEIIGAFNLDLVKGFVSSGLFTANQLGSTGNSNTLTIDTNRLRVADGGTLTSAVLGSGNGADIIIRAQDIEVSGTLIDFGPAGAKSGIITNVNSLGSGQARNLIISTESLRVINGGFISSQTDGSANAGNLQIAANSIEVSGSTILRSATEEFGVTPSQIAASSSTEFAAGSVLLDTDVLQVSNDGEITVSSIADGDAGNLNVTAGNVFLNNGGSLRAEVNGGSRGNINLNVRDALVLGRGSAIAGNATGASTGGNIDINTNILAALQNSSITANAIQGAGGNISISTSGIFVSPDSNVAASSQFGVDGIVEVNNPDNDSTSGLVELSQAPVDPNASIVSGCAVAEGNSFVVTGRGGVPPNPEVQLIGDRSWTDLRDLSRFRGEVGKNSSREPISVVEKVEGAIVEANSWRTNDRGEIELVAVVEGSHPAVSSLPPKCQGTELGGFQNEPSLD